MNAEKTTIKSAPKICLWFISLTSLCFVIGLLIGTPWLLNSPDGKKYYYVADLYETMGNQKQSVAWMQKAMNQGNASAMNSLGIIYSNGKGVEKNPEKALELFNLAAKKGDKYAMYNLGLHYSGLNSKTPPSQNDLQQAVSWYKKAEQGGHECPVHDLGILYAKGMGVEKNGELAKEYFAKSARLSLFGTLEPVKPHQGKRGLGSIIMEIYNIVAWNGLETLDPKVIIDLYANHQMALADSHYPAAYTVKVSPLENKTILELSKKITDECWDF